ncbi:MAG: hypothetical protein R3E42_12330 [Burkholderiaceae bacterium]
MLSSRPADAWTQQMMPTGKNRLPTPATVSLPDWAERFTHWEITPDGRGLVSAEVTLGGGHARPLFPDHESRQSGPLLLSVKWWMSLAS